MPRTIRLKNQPAMFALAKQRQQETPITMQIMAAGLPEPKPEFTFAESIGRKWAADLAWPEWKILFEQEGAAFGNLIMAAPGSYTTVRTRFGKEKRTFDKWTPVRVGGRHNTGAGMQGDCEKYSRAAILGWTVIRATTTMIRDGLAITLLEDAFKAKGFHAGIQQDQRQIR